MSRLHFVNIEACVATSNEAGISFNLELANEDNDLRYTVRGRARVR